MKDNKELQERCANSHCDDCIFHYKVSSCRLSDKEGIVPNGYKSDEWQGVYDTEAVELLLK